MPKKSANKETPAETKAKGTPAAPAQPPPVRRDFLKISLAAGLGTCAVGAPLCAAVRLLSAPASIKHTSGKRYLLTTLDSLDEQPIQQHTIMDDKQDAWMTLPQQKIGSVILRKTGGTVRAFNALCPHAGCLIQVGHAPNPKTGADEKYFYCPCHVASFELDGKRLDTVAPRDMDELEVSIEGDNVFVKFEQFTFGIAEKKAR